MSSSTTPERDVQLLSVGQQCSAPLCGLVDFLPFKCQHCTHSFCRDHFLPESHKCDKFDESKHNRVAPSCPLCNTPIAIPLGQDPNIRMEIHITSECSVVTGRSGKKSTSPTCAKAKCGKVLFAPIQCNKCKQQFCPQHRFPNDHTCTPLSTARSSSKSVSAMQDIASQSSGSIAAIKRAVASMPTSSASQAVKAQPAARAAPSAQSTQTSVASMSPSSTSRHNPFSQTDRLSAPSSFMPSSFMPSPNDDTDNDPPKRCSPKSTSTSISMLFNPYSFIPAPVFASA